MAGERVYVGAVVGGEGVEVEGIAVGGCGREMRCEGLVLLVVPSGEMTEELTAAMSAASSVKLFSLQ